MRKQKPTSNLPTFKHFLSLKIEISSSQNNALLQDFVFFIFLKNDNCRKAVESFSLRF